MSQETYQKAVALMDAANSEDPNKVTVDGKEWPKELLYSHRMVDMLERYKPDAEDAQKLAIRAQHIQRWKSPRDAYPMDRQGYLKWRTDLYKFHAETAGKLLAEAGYDEDFVARVKEAVGKRKLKLNPDTQLLEDVTGRLHQLRPVLDQGVAAAGQGIVDGARDGKNFPALLEGRAGGDKRTGSQRSLHNQGAEAEAADQPVATRKVRCQRCRPGRKFSYQGAVLRDPVSEIPVAGGVDPIQAGAGYRQCSAPCLDCALMSRAIDPASQAAGYRQAKRCQMRGEFTGQRPAGMSGIAAAHDRKLRLRQIIPVAAHEQ